MSICTWYFTHWVLPFVVLALFSLGFSICVVLVNRVMLYWLRKEG